MVTLNNVSTYRRFTNERDKALEQLLNVSRARQANIIFKWLNMILVMIQGEYERLKTHGKNETSVRKLELRLNGILLQMSSDLYEELKSLRKKTYLLTRYSELVSISSTLKKPVEDTISPQELYLRSLQNLPDDTHPQNKFDYEMSRLKKDIFDALEYSLLMDEPVDKALGRVYLKFPKRSQSKRPPLKKVVKTQEAKTELPNAVGFSVTESPYQIGINIDENVWNDILQDLNEKYIPTKRSPEGLIQLTNPNTDDPILRDTLYLDEGQVYQWEIERNVTEDFVRQVRSGQVDAANKNGIDDFIWIAVLDDRTDECCEWRNGLLSSEIEKELKSNKKKREECDATVPPAHFNCRCRLAPADSKMESVDTQDSEKDFEEWLKNNS